MAPHPDSLAPAPIDPSAASAFHSARLGPTHPALELMQKVALAGASNMTAAMVTNPMDLVKVRQQLQSKTADVRSTNWARTLITMVRTEGVLSIYKGLSASLLREGSYSGVRMGFYDMSKGLVLKALPSGWGDKDSFGVKLAGGMASGCLGAAIANPADLLKVRMQTLGATGTLRWHAKDILDTRGFAGLYRAVLPTTLRAGILTASQLGVYDHAKHTLMVDFPGVFREGFWTHAAASGIAGFACSAASSPVDVVKVRIMSDSTGQYKNAVHCAALLLKNEGPLALYKGFTMCFLRLWETSLGLVPPRV